LTQENRHSLEMMHRLFHSTSLVRALSLRGTLELPRYQRCFAAIGTDPQKPKSPATGRMRFLAEFNEKQGKGSGAKKSAESEWKLLSEKQRKPYEKAYKKEFAEYEKKLKDYKSLRTSSKAFERVPLKKPALADPERPKRPVGQWLRFLAQFRQKTDLKSKEVMKVASSEWKTLTTQQRRPFREADEADRAVYEEKMRAYIRSGKADAWKRDPAKPKKPLSSFFLFLKDFRLKPSPKPESPKELIQRAGKEWGELTPALKQLYADESAKALQEYSKQMQAYAMSGKDELWKKKVGLLDEQGNRVLRRRRSG